jgi:hypothetical protein
MSTLNVAPGAEASTMLVLWYHSELRAALMPDEDEPGVISLAVLSELSEELQAALQAPGRAMVNSAAWFIARGYLVPDGQGGLTVAES